MLRASLGRAGTLGRRICFVTRLRAEGRRVESIHVRRSAYGVAFVGVVDVASELAEGDGNGERFALFLLRAAWDKRCDSEERWLQKCK